MSDLHVILESQRKGLRDDSAGLEHLFIKINAYLFGVCLILLVMERDFA